ncbi:hypothetical protein ACHAWF_006571 [Thalassiosira exigua]
MTKAELLSLLALLAAPSASRAELGNHRNMFLRRRTRNLRQDAQVKKDAAARSLEEMSAPVGDDADALEFFTGAEAALIEVVPEEPTEDATDGGAGGSGKPGPIKGDVAPSEGLWAAKGAKESKGVKRRGRRQLAGSSLSMSIPAVDDAEALEFFGSAADLVAVEPVEAIEAVEAVPVVADAAAPEFFAGAEVAEIVVVDEVEAEDVSALSAKSAKGVKSFKSNKTKSSKRR